MLWNAKNGSVRVHSSEMSYVSFGSGEKKLILIPGLSDGLTTVKGKALLLAGSYRLFFERYTVFLFSRIDSMPSDYTIGDMADDQAKAMEELGISEAAVVGVSQGGMIAQLLAARHPEKVNRLVLAVTAPCCSESISDCVNRWIGFAKQADHRQLMIDTAEHSYSEDYLKQYRKLYPLLGMIGKPKNYTRFLINAEAILSFDAGNVLNGIVCPTLIIGGETDRIVGVQASYELQHAIRDSELFIYPGLGHAAYEEAKDFNRRVFDFLEKDLKKDKGDRPMTEEINDTIRRISLYEEKLNRCSAVHTRLLEAMEDFRSIQQDVEDLERYYGGQEWKTDFERDEQGLIPKEIRRGVLSEDGIYSMLEENRELKARINADGAE